MEFGLSFDKILLIGVVAALLIGPEKLPRYAEMLGAFVRRAREFLQGAQARVKEEMGDGFEDVDWRKLDPRQYDPRRIIREALIEEPTPVVAGAAAAARGGAARPSVAPVRPAARRRFSAEEPPPFDSEAT